MKSFQSKFTSFELWGVCAFELSFPSRRFDKLCQSSDITNLSTLCALFTVCTVCTNCVIAVTS